VVDVASGDLLADLTEPGQRAVIARGGRGGRGNMQFATPSNQAPGHAEPGEAGEARTVKVELRLIAEVGIIGFPNVGKSTLISRISAARPKVAEYPFTTLVPNLGVVGWKIGQSFVVADMPGLIEGAHQGHGLGHRFLRHVERCRCLLHLITVEPELPGRGPMQDLDVIAGELESYHPVLASRPTLVALSKLDLPFVREREAELRQQVTDRGLAFRAFSAATGEGLEGLVDALGTLVLQARGADNAAI
jgi:GTP-binding protein